mgnify:CR=1 FL=1|tara:strand:+ start:787 stop:1713 length:927 start_codon:yes stop_codon:yes gene_type:complete
MLKINEIVSSLGSIVESNTEIESLVGWDAQDILKKTGIEKRYIANNDESAESLALQAIKKINLSKIKECDLILSVSNTQHNDFPTIAHYVYCELGIDTKIKCLGFNSGCTGFVDAIELVYSFFNSGFSEKAIIINADTYSKYVHDTDRSTRTIFSDGALVTMVSKDIKGYRITNKSFSCSQSSYEHLIKKEFDGKRMIKMNGPKVLQFSMLNVAKDILELIKPDEEYTLFPHQAGKLVLDVLERKLPKNIKIFKNYPKFGNLVSASIPNLMKENFNEIHNKNKIIISGFGVGLSHNAILLESNDVNVN